MLIEVVDPEPLMGDHVPFRKETGKSEFMEGERGVVVEKGRQCQSKEAFSGERKSAGERMVVIGKGSSASHRRRSQPKENRQGLRSLLFEGLRQSV